MWFFVIVGSIVFFWFLLSRSSNSGRSLSTPKQAQRAVLVARHAPDRRGRPPSTPKQAQPEVELAFDYRTWGRNSTGTSQLNWVGPDDFLEVANRVIQNPLTYTSKGAPREPEASCIDTKLKVGVPVSEPKGCLGYYPEYSDITPDQRANYLQWMASGRTSDLNDIGYAFIFFYGLERRVILDKSDAQPTILEVLRLLKRYPESRSFQSYLTNWVAYVIARSGLEKLNNAWFSRIFDDSELLWTEDCLNMALAWLYLHHKPLPPSLAYHVAKNDSRSPRSVVLKRMPGEHRELFIRKYSEHCQDGLSLKASKRETYIEYRPASPTLISVAMGRHFEKVPIPHVNGIPSQFRILTNIWAESIEELKKASTQIAKGLDFSSREAFEALPPELRAENDHPDKPEWDKLVIENTSTSGFASVKVSSLAELRGIPFRARLTKKQSIDLAKASQLIGYALVPDPWSIQRPYRWDEKVAVLSTDTEIDEESDNYYHAATLMLELGIGMAAADGHIDRDEILHVSHVMRDHFRLPPEYARRLEAYRWLLLKDPPSLTGLGRRIEGILAPDRRQALGKFLVGVAATDGKIDPEERKSLAKVYHAMGLDGSEVEALLQQMEPRVAAPAVVQMRSSDKKTGEAIPEAPSKDGAMTISLNMALVEEIANETAAVARMIGEAMGAYDQTQDSQIVQEETNGSLTDDVNLSGAVDSIEEKFVPCYEGLDERYVSALSDLLRKAEWSKQDLTELARSHSLMPTGLVDAINAWAVEILGDYLIEGDGPYIVQREMMEVLND